MSQSLIIDDIAGDNHNGYSPGQWCASEFICSEKRSADVESAQQCDDISVESARLYDETDTVGYRTTSSILLTFSDSVKSNILSNIICNNDEQTALSAQVSCNNIRFGNCLTLSVPAEDIEHHSNTESAVHDTNCKLSSCEVDVESVSLSGSIDTTVVISHNDLSTDRHLNDVNTNIVSTVVVSSETVDQCHEVNDCSADRGLCSQISSYVCSSFLFSLTRREKCVLLCLAVVDLTSQMCLSIMAPFFPTEVTNCNLLIYYRML